MNVYMNIGSWKGLMVGLVGMWLAVVSSSGCRQSVAGEPQGGGGDDTTTPELADVSRKIAENPSKPDLYGARAGIYYEAERYAEAIADLKQAIRLDSARWEYHHALADSYFDANKSDTALMVLEGYLAKHPKRIGTLLKLAEMQLIVKQYQPSIGNLNKVIELEPQNADAYYQLGMDFKEMGDTMQALHNFQSSVERDPYHIDSYLQLALLCDRLNRGIAVKYFENALRIDSTSHEALFGLAWYYHQRNDFRKARWYYDRDAVHHFQVPDTHFNTGVLLMEQDSLEGARKKFDLAIKVDATFARAYLLRGQVYQKLKNNDKALNDYKQVLALEPDNPFAKKAIEQLAK
jgi:tetratricopeptide (TPR) repeat protein